MPETRYQRGIDSVSKGIQGIRDNYAQDRQQGMINELSSMVQGGGEMTPQQLFALAAKYKQDPAQVLQGMQPFQQMAEKEKMRAAGKDLINVYQQKGGQLEAQDLMGIGQKYGIGIEGMVSLGQLVKQSNALSAQPDPVKVGGNEALYDTVNKKEIYRNTPPVAPDKPPQPSSMFTDLSTMLGRPPTLDEYLGTKRSEVRPNEPKEPAQHELGKLISLQSQFPVGDPRRAIIDKTIANYGTTQSDREAAMEQDAAKQDKAMAQAAKEANELNPVGPDKLRPDAYKKAYGGLTKSQWTVKRAKELYEGGDTTEASQEEVEVKEQPPAAKLTDAPSGAAYGGVNPKTGKVEYFDSKGNSLTDSGPAGKIPSSADRMKRTNTTNYQPPPVAQPAAPVAPQTPGRSTLDALQAQGPYAAPTPSVQQGTQGQAQDPSQFIGNALKGLMDSKKQNEIAGAMSVVNKYKNINRPLTDPEKKELEYHLNILKKYQPAQ